MAWLGLMAWFGRDVRAMVVLAVVLGVAAPSVSWAQDTTETTTTVDGPRDRLLVYEIKGSSADDERPPDFRMKDLVEALSRRIDPYRNEGIRIESNESDQIEILVPDGEPRKVDRVKRLIRRAGTLEFRVVANMTDHAEIINQAEGVEGQEVVDEGNNVIAWWVPVAKGKEENVVKPGEPGTRVLSDKTTEVLVVADPYNVTGEYLANTAPGTDAQGVDCVNFTLVKKGSILFAALTSANQPDPVSGFQRHLGIILDGKLHSAPLLLSTIRSRGQITGGFTKQEVLELVDVLNAEELPVRLGEEPIREAWVSRVVSRDYTIRNSLIAMGCVLGAIVMVLLFILFQQRKSMAR